jgi:hypothetical protein
MNNKVDTILCVIGLILIALLVVAIIPAQAGSFDFGKTTYETADDILIVNSLGDEVKLSTFEKLGTNDFIPENAVKNYLALEGYTQANDYNPSVTNPQFPEYSVKPDNSQEWTKLTFAGLLGDPRTTQDVYVLTKEYDRLSALGQATSIDNLNNGLSSETTNRINGDNLLQNNINVVNTNSQNRDITLQNNINNEATTRSNADNKLQSNINNVNSRVDDVSNRVSALEKTQYIIKTELKFIREKHLEVGVYGAYNVGRNVCSEVGLNVVIPIGESYLDRENKRINTRLDRIERNLGQSTVIERVVDKKGKVKSISISQGQLSVNGQF